MDYKEKLIVLLNGKELSQEQKEKLERIFSELRESEDEKIRKEIIEFVKSRLAGFPQCDKYLAWLEKHKTSDEALQYLKENHSPSEMSDFQAAMNIAVVKAFDAGKKQGEQKSIDKVEPKFKAGDWAIFNGLILHIDEVEDGVYTTTSLAGIHNSYDWEIDKIARLWTIQDAKDGYILVNGSNIFIFHSLNDTRLMGYCHINTDDGIFYDDIGKNECFCLIDAMVTPATKEQRDILMKAMTDAGYAWDAEKKGLKKIEEEINGEDYGIDSLYHAQRILEKTLGKVDDYQSDDGILEHKCAISAVKKLYEQKSWSEEDEIKVKSIIAFLKSPSLCSMDGNKGIIDENIKYLKSLKDRIISQPKQEWSEEDERIYKVVLELIDSYSKGTIGSCIIPPNVERYVKWFKAFKDRPQPKQEWSEQDERTYKSIIYSFAHNYPLTVQQQEFVKSLKHRYTWRPSDEEMEALDIAIRCGIQLGTWEEAALKSLKEQLKKLRGE